MRIKFWDTFNKIWLDPELFVVNSGGKVERKMSVGIVGGITPVFSTSLKDKNGKEIFEGDICKALRGEQEKPDTRYEIKGKVVWFRGGFEVFNKSLSGFYTDDKGNLKDCSWCWHGHNNLRDIYEEIIEIEVIGNIYENKELLQ